MKIVCGVGNASEIHTRMKQYLGAEIQNSRKKKYNARFGRFLKVSFKIGETFKQFSDYRSGIKSRASKMERSWRRRGAAARSSQTAAELRLSFKKS